MIGMNWYEMRLNKENLKYVNIKYNIFEIRKLDFTSCFIKFFLLFIVKDFYNLKIYIISY